VHAGVGGHEKYREEKKSFTEEKKCKNSFKSTFIGRVHSLTDIKAGG
jgi:hypothetical protein